jgi:spore germination protein YaaH
VKRTFCLAVVVVLGTVVLPFCADAGVASAVSLPATVESWIYPASAGQPACDVPAELSALSASPVSVLKPEYLTVSNRGKVLVETAASLPCNGYSAANLAALRTAARKVYVTVSANGRATKAMLGNASRRSVALSSIEDFVSSNQLDGLDLDFEPNMWSSTTWDEYLTFISALVAQMNLSGRDVEVDLFPFATTPQDAVRYNEVAATGAHVVVMAYDHEFDVACAAISPYAWLQQVVTYAQSQVPAADLTIGIPAYGYTTTTCKRIAHVTSNVAYVTMQSKPGFPTTAAQANALRDPSSDEIRWSSGGTFYDLVDSTALNAKLAVVEALGVTDVSVWSLGGEPWFSGNPS